MKLKVSVIIPNYNGASYLNNCLESLWKQDVRAFEIIVVDDASTDHSIEMAKEKFAPSDAFPRISYLEHRSNSGFCTSVNNGIKMAKAPYVILLNNDTVADPSFVRAMVAAITKSERIFSVGAKMLSMQNPEIMDDGGDYYCSLGWAFSPAKEKPEHLYHSKKRIFAACGGAAIYRRQMLLEIGLFDENHFAYLEDIDIGYRAKLHGYVNLFTPKAIVYHAGSATTGSRYNDFKAKYSARNNLYLIYKNMPNWQIILNLPCLLIGIGIKTIFYIMKRLGHTYISGLKEGMMLCCSEEGKRHRVDFKQISLDRQIAIEGELLINTIRRLIG